MTRLTPPQIPLISYPGSAVLGCGPQCTACFPSLPGSLKTGSFGPVPLGIDAPEGVEGERRRNDKEEEHSRRKARPADDRHQPAAVLQTTPDLGGVFGLKRCDAHLSPRLERGSRAYPNYAERSSSGFTGSFRTRLPVAAKIALVTAGAMADVPGSPMPPGDSALFTRWTSTTGASLMRSMR
jgi:hypothetical protein